MITMATNKIILGVPLTIFLAIILLLGYEKYEKSMLLSKIYEVAKKDIKTPSDYKFIEESSLFTEERFVKGSVISVDNGLFVLTSARKNSITIDRTNVDGMSGDKYEIFFVNEKNEVTTTPKNEISADKIIVFTPKNVYSIVQKGKYAGFLRAERN